jgi:hypothetical protein
MVRFSQKGNDLDLAKSVVDGLMKRRYPFAESIDGRVYADVGKSALDVALVILHYDRGRSRSSRLRIQCLSRRLGGHLSAHSYAKNIALWIFLHIIGHGFLGPISR